MGGKTSTSTQSVSIPPEVLARYNSVNQTAQSAASAPFTQYSTNPNAFVAPLTQTQQAGIANTNSSAGQAQPFYQQAANTLEGAQSATAPYYGAATGLAAASAAPVNAQQIGPQQIGQFLSPYLSTVLGGTAGVLNQQNQQQQEGALGNAISQGAFGGDRAGIGAANLEQQQNLANSQIYSGILNAGYNNALGAAQQQQGVNLGAGQANRAALASASQQIGGLGQAIYGTGAATSQGEAGLGAGAQTASLQGAQAQLGAGQAEQQTGQAGLTALYNQFLQQQSYPFQTAQFLANIAEGTGALSGSTTTTQQPGGFFSDERLKTNIKPIGKSYDGQTIYSFRYKDDAPNVTRIGFKAQEVEKKHPGAVGESHGFKTVDYGKATEDAAKRGKFAAGGSPTLPGPYAGVDLGALLSAQEQMYAPYGGSGLYGGSSSGVPHGGSGYVPQASLPVSHLAVAGGLGTKPASLAQNVSDWANLAKAGSGLAQTAKGLMPSNDNVDPTGANAAAYGASAGAYTGQDPLAARRGGSIRARRASGGGLAAMAYADGGQTPDDMYAHGLGIDIPDEKNDRQLSVAGSLPGGGGSGASSLEGIASLAGGIGSAAKGLSSLGPLFGVFKSGGRVALASGGSDGGYSDDVGSDIANYFSNPVRPLMATLGLGSLAAPTAETLPDRPGRSAFDNYRNTVNDPLAALAAAPGGISDTTAVPGPPPVTVADIAKRLGPNAPVHVAPHPGGGLSVSPASPPDQTAPTTGAGLAATDMMGSLQPGSMTSDTVSADPGMQPAIAPTGLAAPGAGLPAKVRPDAGSSSPGLSGAAENVVGSALGRAGDWLAPKGGFFDKLGHGKTEAVVPFLAALGAMGTAPTRSLGVALASGVGAGANAYMGTQQQQANIARTQAATGLEKTTAYDLLQKNAPPNMQAVPGAGPDGKAFPGPDGKPWHYELKVGYANFSPTGGGAASTTVADASGKPVTTDYKTGTPVIGPTAATDSYISGLLHTPIDPSQPGVANASRAFAMNPELAAQNDTAQKAAQSRIGNLADTDAAHRQMIQLAEAVNDLPSSGAFAPGRDFDARASLANIYTTASNILGIPPDPSISGAANVSQITDKIRTLQGVALAHQGDERAAQIAHALTAVLPGGNLQPGAANDILSTMIIQNQQQRDFAQYYQNYVARTGMSVGAEQAFQHDMGPIYDREQTTLAKALKRSGQNPSPAQIISKNPDGIQRFERGTKKPDGSGYDGFGEGFSRYFR